MRVSTKKANLTMINRQILSILKKAFLFSGLSDEELASFLKASSLLNFKKGELIFSDGDKARGFYIVIEGTVRIFKVSYQGKEHTLHILGPGEPFGEVAAFTNIDYPAFSIALTPVKAIFLSKENFLKEIQRHPATALSMLGVLSLRLKAFNKMIEDLALKKAPSRLAAYLLSLIDIKALEGNISEMAEKRVRLHISKNLLSTIIGTSAETLSRTLKKMEQADIIRREPNGDIYIRQIEPLKKLAEGGE